MFYFDTPGAIAEFERAIELNPNDVTAHHWLAHHPLAVSGQFERELAEMKHARELDPLSLIVNTNLGWAYIYPMRLDARLIRLTADKHAVIPSQRRRRGTSPTE